MYLLDIVIQQLVTLCHSDRPHVPACNKVYCNLDESVKLIVVDAACCFFAQNLKRSVLGVLSLEQPTLPCMCKQ